MSANILIVEDEWLIAEHLASVLRAAELRVIGPCASVRSALSCIDETSLSAAIIDIELKGENSFAVAELLREKNVPFAFLSGHSIRALPPSLRRQRLLSKPIEKATLLAAIREMCASGQENASARGRLEGD